MQRPPGRLITTSGRRREPSPSVVENCSLKSTCAESPESSRTLRKVCSPQRPRIFGDARSAERSCVVVLLVVPTASTIARTCSLIADLSCSRAFSSASTDTASLLNASCAGVSTSFMPPVAATLCFSNVSFASVMKLACEASRAFAARAKKRASSDSERSAFCAWVAASSAVSRVFSSRKPFTSTSARSRSFLISSAPPARACACMARHAKNAAAPMAARANKRGSDSIISEA